MLQILLLLITVVFTGIIAYLTARLTGASIIYNGLGALLELDWILQVTPAQVSYLMFVMQSAILISVFIFTFKISNHSILSLDILYLISMLMLILFHNLKEAGNLHVRECSVIAV